MQLVVLALAFVVGLASSASSSDVQVVARVASCLPRTRLDVALEKEYRVTITATVGDPAVPRLFRKKGDRADTDLSLLGDASLFAKGKPTFRVLVSKSNCVPLAGKLSGGFTCELSLVVPRVAFTRQNHLAQKLRLFFLYNGNRVGSFVRKLDIVIHDDQEWENRFYQEYAKLMQWKVQIEGESIAGTPEITPPQSRSAPSWFINGHHDGRGNNKCIVC